MGFYKKTDTELMVAENFVYSPNVTLKADEKDNHTYPQDGWYWFDTLDEAISFFAVVVEGKITMRQARLYLLNAGLLASVDALMQTNEAWKIEWEYGSEVLRTSPLVGVLSSQLSLTSEQIDAMFAEAGQL